MKYLLEKYRKWRESRQWRVMFRMPLGSTLQVRGDGKRRYFLSKTRMYSTERYCRKALLDGHFDFIIDWVLFGEVPEGAIPVTQKENEND